MLEQKIHQLASTLRAINSQRIIAIKEGKMSSVRQLESVRADIENKLVELSEKQQRKAVIA
ncbi:MAG: hypothetical protein EBY39_02920 [Flavobacteriia bacterium]|jgi:hypothetical protein|nr:hypothetical protein [Flavobacteriia bacterium]